MISIATTRYYKEPGKPQYTEDGYLEGDGMDDGPLEFDTVDEAMKYLLELNSNEHTLAPYEWRRPEYVVEVVALDLDQ